MNQKLVISVDSGKHSTKLTYLDRQQIMKKEHFPSTFKEVMKKDDLSIGFYVEYKGKKYHIGDKVDHTTYSTNSKLCEDTELFVYSAIARAIKAMKFNSAMVIDVFLALNIPLNEYRISSERNKYIEHYQNSIKTIMYDDTEYTINIRAIDPYFESQGVILRYYNQYSVMERVYVIDIGGKNDTHSFFEFGRINGIHTNMFNNGILSMLGKLQMAMNRESNTANYSINDIEYMIRNKKYVGNFLELYKIHAIELLNEILLSTTKTGVNLNLTHVVFTGGGALLLEPFIEEVFENIEYELKEDCYEDNSVGGLQFAMRCSKKYNEK